MIPTSFEQSNVTLSKPESMSDQECMPLPVCVTDNGKHGIIVSKWRLNKEELEQIQQDGCIWLGVVSSAMPPVWLTTEDPFQG